MAVSVAHPRLPVKLVGAYSGLLSGNNGATHQAVEDVAIMRALPNLTVVDPADAVEMYQAVAAVADHDGPVYLRMSRDAWPRVVPEGYRFRLGKGVVLRSGGAVALVCSGLMASLCLTAADDLAERGISALVLHLPTIKPLDVEALGEWCPVPLQRVGLRDVYGECGSNAELLDKYGLSPAHIVQAALAVLARKH